MAKKRAVTLEATRATAVAKVMDLNTEALEGACLWADVEGTD
jgi:hypothetical protein